MPQVETGKDIVQRLVEKKEFSYDISFPLLTEEGPGHIYRVAIGTEYLTNRRNGNKEVLLLELWTDPWGNSSIYQLYATLGGRKSIIEEAGDKETALQVWKSLVEKYSLKELVMKE